MEEPTTNPQSEDPADKIDRSQERYRLSQKGKKAQRRYRESEDGRAAQRRYQNSDRGRTAHERYRHSERGRETREKASETTKVAKAIALLIQQREEAGLCTVCGEDNHATDSHPV